MLDSIYVIQKYPQSAIPRRVYLLCARAWGWGLHKHHRIENGLGWKAPQSSSGSKPLWAGLSPTSSGWPGPHPIQSRMPLRMGHAQHVGPDHAGQNKGTSALTISQGVQQGHKLCNQHNTLPNHGLTSPYPNRTIQATCCLHWFTWTCKTILNSTSHRALTCWISFMH